ncbi:adenosine deaminase [Sciscionella marina]|uniref:adenosine deaminase n=1 Tax=Sciscionella marina TaxID=508770 RepID=UPI00036490B2|nr:adenosine deaminase [Sciscionella marina]
MTIPAFIAALPKAELHLHLVGSASPETVLTLARRHPDGAVPTDPAELERFYEFVDFPHFIDNYAKVDELVRTGEDVRELVLGAARDAAKCQVRYAEITVTPVMHIRKGVAPEELGETLTAARIEAAQVHGVELNYIYDIPAGFGGTEETVDFAVRVRPEGTVALGLAGLEDGYPRAGFADAFATARDAGLHVVAHAGETTGPDEVWAAVRELHAERIGHGIGSVTDPELLDHLARNGIPLEVCPMSNLRTRATESFEAHPLPRLLASGAPITLSTDDPGMFHTDLDTEYTVAARLCELDKEGLAELARNSIRYSYAAPEIAERILAEIDSVLASA